jgi:hypothetical protein
MKIAKRAIIFYVAGVLAMVVYIYSLNDPPTELLAGPFIYLIPAVALLIGLVIGWFGLMIIQHSKWIRSFYLCGLNVCFILFLAALGVLRCHVWENNRRYGYDPASQEILENADERGSRYVADGFEKLLRAFPDPRDLHLIEFQSTFRDTTVGSEKDSVLTIYYTHFSGRDSNAIRFSAVELWKEHTKKPIKILALNQLPASDTVYLRHYHAYHEWKNKKADSIITLIRTTKLGPALAHLIDSVRQR